MIDFNRSNDRHRFHVALGHSQVTVEGRDRTEAILNARQSLSAQMPRLYDLIRSAKDESFQVERLS